MSHHLNPIPGLGLRPRSRKALRYIPLGAALAAALGFAVFGMFPDQEMPLASLGEHPPVPAREAADAPSPGAYAAMLDSTPFGRPEALTAWQDVPLGPSFQLATPRDTIAKPPLSPMEDERERPLPSPPPETKQLVSAVPFPVPRPSELGQATAPEPSRMADGQIGRPARSGAPPAADDNRSFVEKLFGLKPSSGPALAYAALGGDANVPAPGTRLSPGPSAPTGPATAVYDISARVVHMPNGEKLEAHSGLGDAMDDPRHVSVRMRGPTPPGTYDLTEREQLFHGVRALRLHPVGGSAAIYGRTGLLTHSYLLGPTGASNGCVSFKDYDRFLQAYLNGEVRRLVVVSGNRQDGPPGILNRLFGMSNAPALGRDG